MLPEVQTLIILLPRIPSSWGGAIAVDNRGEMTARTGLLSINGVVSIYISAHGRILAAFCSRGH